MTVLAILVVVYMIGAGGTAIVWTIMDISPSEILKKMQLVKPSYSLRSSFIYQNIFYIAALFFCNCNIHGKQDGCRSINSHGSGNAIKANAVKQNFHIAKRVNRDTRFTHFTFSKLMV